VKRWCKAYSLLVIVKKFRAASQPVVRHHVVVRERSGVVADVVVFLFFCSVMASGEDFVQDNVRNSNNFLADPKGRNVLLLWLLMLFLLRDLTLLKHQHSCEGSSASFVFCQPKS
jgi:hypothetical protein